MTRGGFTILLSTGRWQPGLVRTSVLAFLFQRALPLWMPGYPEAALADCDQATKDAREIGLATTLMPALLYTSMIHIFCGNDEIASRQANELVALADEKGSALWKAFGVLLQGVVLALTGRPSEARANDHARNRRLARRRDRHCGYHSGQPGLAKSCISLGQTDEASALHRRGHDNDQSVQGKVVRAGGQSAGRGNRTAVSRAGCRGKQKHISLGRSRLRASKRAKSWELRAATSLARLWKDRGECDKARGLRWADLRLVHRGISYARFARGKRVA